MTGAARGIGSISPGISVPPTSKMQATNELLRAAGPGLWLVSDAAAKVTGQTVAVDGGRGRS
ncbi:MAG TPA: hypothetical protein VGI28_17190 [Stellaceae bacterium]|jgi:NAD(P)-dependent dehydrogenase (short-subunit alcohol dehydrogenase family)